MAKVVAPGAFGTSLQINGGSNAAPKAKRKTPSELREEQLKRTAFVNQTKETFDALRPCKSAERENGLKKQELSKNPKYIEMRMDELYPVKKARPWMPSGKEISKENGAKQSSSLINVSLLSNVAANKRQLIREENNASTKVSDDIKTDACQTNERCSQSVFRSVTELSTRGEEFSCLPDIDMNKALKGLATCEPLLVHPNDITGKSDNASFSENFMSEFQVPGQKIPLDLSLKTYARLVSSSPVKWLHRSIMGSTYNGMPQPRLLSCSVVNQDNSSSSGSDVVSQVLNSMSLHSWVYPQSTLPPSIISALIASGSDRGLLMRFLELDLLIRPSEFYKEILILLFLVKLNSYKIENWHGRMLFEVCILCFGRISAKYSMSVLLSLWQCSPEAMSQRVSNVHAVAISPSQLELRAMLRDLDIDYSMPLCKTKMDQTTVEDLAELSEIENHNIGQIRHLRSVSNIDNTPESFLAFVGNESVHGLYDLLLNYSSSFGFLPTVDVPVLYSPVPFQNAAVSSPEIKCTEMERTEHLNCCMVEIKGKYLPPWIISNICANVGANGQNFEASLVTEPTSVNLNIGLPQVLEKTDPESRVTEGMGETNDDASGIPGAVICPQLRSGHLKSLKYCNKSYTVSLSPS